jgi:acyl dehydratase
MDTDANVARAARYFEDYVPGTVFEGGPIVVDAAEIVAFARRYDPQSFHVDAAAAADSIFGGLIASGWHTVGLTMRLLVEHYLSEASSLGSPGIDELRWLKPVRPADELRVRVSILEARRSHSKPDRGLVRAAIDVSNQRGEQVLSMKAMNLMRLRDPGAADATPGQAR